MTTYTDRLNVLRADARKELERLIRRYGKENTSEYDESTYSVFIDKNSPQFKEINRMFCQADYPIELTLDATEHAYTVDFIAYSKDNMLDIYVESTDDICMLVDYFKQKFNDK